jgi:TalC/MipB family fructose-6-phosphate aldolase
MALYADSAVLDEVSRLLATYPLAGATTNPTILLAARQQGQDLADLAVLRGLLDLGLDTVFMQPVGDTAEELRADALRFVEADPGRVVLKLPMTRSGLEAARLLKREGARCSFTAVFSLAQTYGAAIAGAEWIIPYFSRLRRASIDPCQRLSDMSSLLKATATDTRILAASMRGPSDVVEAMLAGAHDITAQPNVIAALSDDPLTAAAMAQFAADARATRTG